ncbi:conserved exported hypothetical protein [Rhodococcus sp. RD6.2]|uniref:hypothetical protein n=1 Tax=Rhodococcus sp. RD6.2 TaxID=260936 RepID=UPI00063B3FB5|nr:hypothetical protein [Rhodococcus sp. RD6.2]CRK50716.1 conserved exported hypothetical protein [Rhodococcus sp. RD6.2]
MSNKTRWLVIGGAAVVGVGLLSAQQTGALWTQSQTVDAGTIHSGVLDLSVGGNGLNSYPFTALAGANLMPGGYAQAPVKVYNSGNVLMKYRLLNGSQSNPAVPLDLTASIVPNEAACPATGSPAGATQLYSGPLIGAQFAERTVQPGATEVLCLRGTIGAAAAHSQSTTATFTFSAQSR